VKSRHSKRRDVAQLAATLEARGLIDLARGIAADHCVTVGDLIGDQSCATNMRARREFVRVLRLEHRLSYPEIGALLDRDHSTIMAMMRLRGALKPRKAMRELMASVDAALEEMRVV
jgi:chromosomal replication initiation ATPase DnaA